ncbi:MAG: hypothetical protein JSS89_13290 [Bacteroidetes bacterium]|nr:hypothetical protein [Bacteroidota bacterium]
MNELEIEQAIVDRLKSELEDVMVLLFPDVDEFEFRDAKAAIVCRFSSARFDTPGNGATFQTTYPQLEVLVFSRSLRDHTGVLTLLRRVRAALTGFVPPMCSRSPYPIDERFLAHDEDVWSYGMTLEVPSIYQYGS